MSHVLIVRDRDGKIVAEIPVQRGYTVQEVAAKPKAVGVGDSAKATEKNGK